jgi:DNA polymerase/3'-5' exonuclease PolX
MRLDDARALAAALMEEMRPHCERLELAGSVRRGKAEPKDLEIVAIPLWEPMPDPADLFGERTLRRNRLWEWANRTRRVRWLKPAVPHREPWRPKEDGKYWRGELENGAPLDLFLTEPGNFGIITVIRTGPAEFSQAVVTQAKVLGRPCEGGWLTDSKAGGRIETPDEESVFRALSLYYVPPEERVDRTSLRYRPGRNRHA